MTQPAQHSIDQATSPVGTGGVKGWLAAAGGLAGGLGAAGCCLIPFALFSVGVGGAWIGRLGVLSPYQPYFAGFAVVCLAAGFYFVYRKPKAGECAPGSECARPGRRRVVKIMLWLASALVVAALGFLYVLPLLV